MTISHAGPTDYASLSSRLEELTDLRRATEILYWDHATKMPTEGASWRGRQVATLSRIAHERSVDPELGELLERLDPVRDQFGSDSVEASMIRVAQRDFDRSTRVPADFVAKFEQHKAETYEVWQKARAENSFTVVRDHLARTLEFSQQYAQFFPGAVSPADPFIAESDEGMTAELVRKWFSQLKEELVPLVKVVTSAERPETAFLHHHYPKEEQFKFGEQVAASLGYDFKRGRQDETVHPFMVRFSPGDIRITTRAYEDDVTDALFGTIHETGHALYEQGVDLALGRRPRARGTSAGVHESQSRLWENIGGRSLPFWRHFFPKIQAAFPEQLAGVTAQAFHRAVNDVRASLIRTEADELTYNLHVMIRFEIELDLLEGRLSVDDLPARWSDDYKASLGVAPETHVEGVLQDVHWYAGQIGGEFQGYTLGNIMSAQIFQAAQKAHPEITAQMAEGQFATLLTWLTDNVYRYGRTIDPLPLIAKATGAELSIAPYIAYLTEKYSTLYSL